MKRIHSFLFLFTVLCWQYSPAQNWTLTHKLGSSDHAPADNLGISVAISDSFMLAGAWWEDGEPSVTSSGAAYLYKQMPNGDWVEVQKLSSPNPESLGYFGFRVALDGDFALVGAYNEDEGVTGNAGAVYVYQLGFNDTMLFRDRLIASDGQNGDVFGYSLALTGNYALIGAYHNSYDENGENFQDDAGAAYLFKRQPNDTWAQIRKLVAFDRGAGANFGRYVDIDDLGLVIGAPNADFGFSPLKAGKAYGAFNDTMLSAVFDNITTNRLQPLSISDPGNFESFGADVAISGKWAVIGKPSEADQPGGGTGGNTGAAHFFHWENNQWVEKQKVYASDFAVNSHFGANIGIDGKACVIGAGTAREDANGGPSIVGAGEAYVFELKNNGMWQEVERLSGTHRAVNDLFGEAVDISGSTVVVGAWLADTLPTDTFPDAGAVYLYERDGALSIADLPELAGVSLVNNPAGDGLLHLVNVGESGIPVDLRVLNMNGQTLFAENVRLQAAWTQDLSHLPSGMYLLQVRRKGYLPQSWKWLRP